MKKKNKSDDSKLAIQFTYIGMMAIGLTGLLAGVIIDSKNETTGLLSALLNNIGTTIINLSTTILTIGLVTMFFEWKLRQRFMKRISNEFESIIDDKMPERYDRLTKSGIIDGFEELEFSKLRDRLDNAKNCDIIFYKMWISNIDDIEKSLERAVGQNGCTVRILLLDPECDSTITARAKVLDGRTPEMIKEAIQSNIKVIKSIIKRLDESCKTKIELKTHQSFIPCSMIAIGEVISLGLYLNDQLSTQGIHIRFAGKTRTHPQALFSHFENEWSQASPKVDAKKAG